MINRFYDEHKDVLLEAFGWSCFGYGAASWFYIWLGWIEPHALLLYTVFGIPFLTVLQAKAIKWQREKGSDKELS